MAVGCGPETVRPEAAGPGPGDPDGPKGALEVAQGKRRVDARCSRTSVPRGLGGWPDFGARCRVEVHPILAMEDAVGGGRRPARYQDPVGCPVAKLIGQTVRIVFTACHWLTVDGARRFWPALGESAGANWTPPPLMLLPTGSSRR